MKGELKSCSVDASSRSDLESMLYAKKWGAGWMCDCSSSYEDSLAM